MKSISKLCLITMISIVTCGSLTSCKDNLNGKFLNYKIDNITSALSISQSNGGVIYKYNKELEELILAKSSFILFVTNSNTETTKFKKVLDQWITNTENLVYKIDATSYSQRPEKLANLPTIAYEEAPALVFVKKGVAVGHHKWEKRINWNDNKDKVFYNYNSLNSLMNKYIYSDTSIYSLVAYSKSSTSDANGDHYIFNRGDGSLKDLFISLKELNTATILYYSSYHDISGETNYTNTASVDFLNQVLLPYSRKTKTDKLYVYDMIDAFQYDGKYNEERLKNFLLDNDLSSGLTDKLVPTIIANQTSKAVGASQPFLGKTLEKVFYQGQVIEENGETFSVTNATDISQIGKSNSSLNDLQEDLRIDDNKKMLDFLNRYL